MKINAIIRIITWSLVIVVLLGILTAGMGFRGIQVRWDWDEEDTPVATHIPQLIEETTTQATLKTTFTADTTINVRSKPSPTAEVLGAVEEGASVSLTRDEQINGQHWGYITEPLRGWILLDVFAEETVYEPITTEPSANEVSPSPDGNTVVGSGYGCNAADVSDISIEWAAGNIQIIPVDNNRIQVTETGDFEKYPMVLKNKNGKLSIEYSEEKALIGISLGKEHKKDLIIEIPKGHILRELEIEAASATVLVQGLEIQNVEFDGASGTCEFQDCNIGSLDIDTASGDVHFTGTLQAMECDAASASFVGILKNVPRGIEMETASGNLDLTLPENAGFTIVTEGMKRNFTSEFPTTCDKAHHSQDHGHSSCDAKIHTHGDGACRIQMEALSGEVIIRKG